MGKYYRCSGTIRRVTRSSWICSSPIKKTICLTLTILLFFYILRYLVRDGSPGIPEIALTRTEIRKIPLLDTPIETNGKTRQYIQLSAKMDKNMGKHPHVSIRRNGNTEKSSKISVEAKENSEKSPKMSVEEKENQENADTSIKTKSDQLPNKSKLNQLIQQNQQNGGRGIPKIIHQTWDTNSIPDVTIKWVKKWKETNPDWKYVFWNDRTSRAFMAHFFPEYLRLYDGFEQQIQKADLFRYFVLYTIGGVYADLDMEPLRSLNEIALKSPCTLSREPYVNYKLLFPEFSTKENNFTLACNALIMCRRGHPYMKFLIDQIVERRARVPSCPIGKTLLCTGPYILSTAWVKYKALYYQHIQDYPDDDVMCPEPDYFLPTWDPLRTGSIRVKCTSKTRYDKLDTFNKELCDKLKGENFRNYPKDWSYTNHHWFHSWLKERSRYLRKNYPRTHIHSAVPDVVYGADLIPISAPKVVESKNDQ